MLRLAWCCRCGCLGTREALKCLQGSFRLCQSSVGGCGATVTIGGLVNATGHNGSSQVVAFGFDSAKERFTVYMMETHECKCAAQAKLVLLRYHYLTDLPTPPARVVSSSSTQECRLRQQACAIATEPSS
jgi:hypothetical protein